MQFTWPYLCIFSCPLTRGGFSGTADLEWTTLLSVDRFNNRKLHGSIEMIPPSEFEINYYTQRELENRSVLK